MRPLNDIQAVLCQLGNFVFEKHIQYAGYSTRHYFLCYIISNESPKKDKFYSIFVNILKKNSGAENFHEKVPLSL